MQLDQNEGLRFSGTRLLILFQEKAQVDENNPYLFATYNFNGFNILKKVFINAIAAKRITLMMKKRTAF